jgi:8-oxo-dGTP diphosphatase
MSRNITLTVDGLITIGGEEVVLIRRAKPPFMDKLVLPGGHVETDDVSMPTACARELQEEIGLTVDPEELTLHTVLDAQGADPRPGHRVSVVYHRDYASRSTLGTLAAASDAEEIVIRSIENLSAEEMGFDHFQAILALRK